jgi:ABC-type multidrug transport system fused ATPase/permease subunit
MAMAYSKSFLLPPSYLKNSKFSITEDNSRGTLIYWISIYLGISIFMVLEGTTRYLVVFHGSIKASRDMFERLTYAVLRAPLRWLDTVPVGRVLNRFTADFHLFDFNQAYGLSFLFWNFLSVLGIAVAGSVATKIC